ncbi:hypothetical protein HJC23_004716 [Cyclotella cryptica]|uniref:Uncharacterized protein n=1 Tax=Cyclotella cryptica TaxID=29204 RepID=A0ABD3PXE5_9STRA|eukprot:CCRYP_012058-RA/>CCRYP_012058-RA protein AED:0.03 eAED:0.02 QI:0/0/0/1/1/1/2/0/718
MDPQHPALSEPQLTSRKQGRSKSLRSTSLLVVAVLILVVLGNQWRLARHYVHVLHGHDYHASSLASFLAQQADFKPNKAEYSIGGSYIHSPICGACYRGKSRSGTPCHDIVEKYIKTSGFQGSFVDAATLAGRKQHECELCDPQKCHAHYLHAHDTGFDSSSSSTNSNTTHYQYKYWRFDRVYPKFTNPTTLTLSSIPSHLRIPPSRFHDIATFFEERYNSSLGQNTSGLDFLVEYNPGIVTLPPNINKYLPKEAAYLISMRVTPANNCFPADAYSSLPKDVWTAVYHTTINHLGLALLDENYDMLPGYDVIIEIDRQLNLRREMKKAGDVSPTFMDYRIFLLNGEVYLHANADTTSVTKIKLRAKGFGDDADSADNNTSATKDPSDDEAGKPYRNFKLTNLYGGDLLQVSMEHQFNTLWSGGVNGKNYALFGIPNKTHPDAEDAVYAEIDIIPRHRVHRVILDEYEHISLRRVFEYLWKPGTSKSRKFQYDKVNRRSMKTVGNITESDDAPLPSFFNVDAVWYPGSKAPFKESAHGGACCVEFSVDDINMGGMRNTHHESLLVGIAHTKVPWRPWYTRATQEEKDLLPHTHYVSLFYAFDPRPPFQLRARSGYFCLGFVPPSSFENTLPSSERGRFNPHNILTRNRPLKQHNITFDCPQMHFVSSFAQKANDATRVVIGYGLNDCTGRLVEVRKEEVVRLLFPEVDMLVEPTDNSLN